MGRLWLRYAILGPVFPRPIRPRFSRNSNRPTARSRARRAEPVSVCRSPSASSRCTAGGSGSNPNPAGDRRSASRCRCGSKHKRGNHEQAHSGHRGSGRQSENPAGFAHERRFRGDRSGGRRDGLGSGGASARLLSSIAAFLRTLKAHRKTLQRLVDGEKAQATPAAAQAFVGSTTTEQIDDLGLEDDDAEKAMEADEEATAEAASVLGASDASAGDLRTELAAVDEMLARAKAAALKPDARVEWLVRWIKDNLLSGEEWNDRRLIVFTEWEDTRRWLERRLCEALADTDQADERIAIFTGVTGQDRREEVKAAFNADPNKEPLRILICTDAAREGINLQIYCADIVHFDLPWNPSRLEQRNGRIDRKLQPAKQVFCRYFRYEQREADIVLDALVRKTVVIHEQLGSAGQVIEKRIKDRME